MQKQIPAALAAAGAALVLAACGSSSTTTSPSAGSSGGAGYGASGSGSGSAGAAGAAKSGGTLSTKHNAKLGTILAVGPKHMTVYLFAKDAKGKSACSGACTSAWPVVGKVTAGAGVKRGLLGTIKRSDGSTQATYAGHPLYTYASDGDAGDTYGQAIDSFGAYWYVLSGAGKQVGKS